jgi:hypothetical protein
MSTNFDLARVAQDFAPLGVRRTFYQWNEPTREQRGIEADHSAGRLPWVSFRPPSVANAWTRIAAGEFDADIRARARRYASLTQPVVSTFHHEPQGETGLGPYADWSAAHVRIHNVMARETSLANVTFAPIIGDWVFNPINKRDEPGDFLRPAVLSRLSLLGIDLYQNRQGDGFEQRLGRILAWLDAQGRPDLMVGVGETGASDTYGILASTWWSASWAWATRNTNRVGIVSYYNSTNLHNGVRVSLYDSPGLRQAYRSSQGSPVTCRL